MIKLFSTENPNTAEIIKQMLEENNINVVLLNKQDSSYNMFGSIELYVEKENLDSAKSLITKAQYE
jgi:aspartokinase